MNALDSLAEKHPTGTGLWGVLVSGLGWLLSNIDAVTGMVRLLGACLMVVSSGLTIYLLIRRIQQRRLYIRELTAREIAEQEDRLP